MQKVLFLCLIGLFLGLTAFKTEFSASSKQMAYPPQDSNYHLLAVYGKYLYNENGCRQCHSGQSYQFVSLDGLGGKYSDDWHYYHLIDPKMVSPYSGMPNYPQLATNEIKNDSLILFVLTSNKDNAAANYAQLSDKEILQQFHAQAKKLANNISNRIRDIDSSKLARKEIVAMIAYLQQIPLSKEKREADSIDNFEKNKRWEIDSNPEIALNIAKNNQPESIARGKQIFEAYCMACHGTKGQGGVGPNLTDEYWINGSKSEDIIKIIADGMPTKGMIAWKTMLESKAIGQVTAYIHSLKGSNPANAKEPQGKKQ